MSYNPAYAVVKAADNIFPLLSLPCDLLLCIINYLTFDDVFNLCFTCKYLHYTLTEGLGGAIAKAKLKFTIEFQEAQSHGNVASVLRGVVKRREAVATARPFAVATIGFADAYLYCNGVLCYTLDQTVRILDLYRSENHETVIRIQGLLTTALSDKAISTWLPENFRILYYSNDIISCLYISSTSAWIIAFDIKTGKILTTRELETRKNIFVRHNRQFLYYGTRSGRNAENPCMWVIHGHDFKNTKWFDKKVYLTELTGSRIGIDVCFELYQEYFYAFSTMDEIDTDEHEWSTFYSCMRFPLAFPCPEQLETTDIWRRDQTEGAIETRCTTLRLDIDGYTGKPRIIELRMERTASDLWQRTCYTTDIIFPYQEDLDLDHQQLPKFQHPPLRLPQNIHPETESYRSTSAVVAYLLRYYSTSATTFVDIINDPQPSCPETQRLRLRVNPRHIRHARENYDPIKYWPAEHDCSSADLNILYTLLNPPTHLGSVQGTADERSMVYLTGKEPRAIMFISFDPAICLMGLQRWNDTKETPACASEDWGRICDWARKEAPMYLDIGRGYYFGLDRKRKN